LADRNGELYLWVCVYDDAGEVLYETGCYQEHLQKMKELDQEPARRAKTERFS